MQLSSGDIQNQIDKKLEKINRDLGEINEVSNDQIKMWEEWGVKYIGTTTEKMDEWTVVKSRVSKRRENKAKKVEDELNMRVNQTEKALGSIMEVQGEMWELIKVNVDSGAIDSVCNEKLAPQFEIKETQASKSGSYYWSASKHKLFNKGEKSVKGFNDLGNSMGMVFQVCDVKSPLGSVRRICQAGNRVIFDDNQSYIENKATGIKTPITQENGVYYLNAWVKKEGFSRRD